jgi:formylglycine-generating enzyme required for sulfatase activity
MMPNVGCVMSAMAVNTTGPRTGRDRLLRGGFWLNNSSNCRGSQRNFNSPDNAFENFGFRAVRTP